MIAGGATQPTTPVSLSCTDTEPMPSSVESGAGPLVKARSWGTKRRVGFAIDDDSTASGSQSLQTKAYRPCKRELKMLKTRRNKLVLLVTQLVTKPKLLSLKA